MLNPGKRKRRATDLQTEGPLPAQLMRFAGAIDDEAEREAENVLVVQEDREENERGDMNDDNDDGVENDAHSLSEHTVDEDDFVPTDSDDTEEEEELVEDRSVDLNDSRHFAAGQDNDHGDSETNQIRIPVMIYPDDLKQYPKMGNLILTVDEVSLHLKSGENESVLRYPIDSVRVVYNVVCGANGIRKKIVLFKPEVKPVWAVRMKIRQVSSQRLQIIERFFLARKGMVKIVEIWSN
jgi:hypothetical protein